MGCTWCGDAMCELSSAENYLVGCAHCAQSPIAICLDCIVRGSAQAFQGIEHARVRALQSRIQCMSYH